MPPRVVTLSVGGEIFKTAQSTLAKSAFFRNLLSNDYIDAQSDEVFVDRDPRYFRFVLQYLRTGSIETPQLPLTAEGLMNEYADSATNTIMRKCT